MSNDRTTAGWVNVCDEPKPPKPRWEIVRGSVRISIQDAYSDDSQRWQYLSISLGEHSTLSAETLKNTWPTRALFLAREALDRMEEDLRLTEEVDIGNNVPS